MLSRPRQVDVPALSLPRSRRLGRAAIAALYDELSLFPKPGLVSFVDSGSHADMDAAVFMRSLFSLRHDFLRMAELGAVQAAFAELQTAGINAELRMLVATGGVNTHRGAIFTLGLLCAAAGLAARPVATTRLRQLLMAQWGAALQQRQRRERGSQGQRAVLALGLRGAGEEAALGFPAVFDLAAPALAQALHSGLDASQARLQTLMTVMAELDDTNLAHRGGLAGLQFAQAQARSFLAAGGAARADAVAHATAIHHAFVARRLSPGGAADVLAAACLLQRICTPA